MHPRIRITPDFQPRSDEELIECIGSWEWRMFSGKLYMIMAKSGDDDTASTVVPFFPNAAQRQFLTEIHTRNVILKARQLGFTTLICILWLDHALFNSDQRCGIIAHEKDAAIEIFRDKVAFAYDMLPEVLRTRFPLKKRTEQMLHFGHNNSAIRVGVSLRSGTFQRLHVSEMGKVSAKHPGKAIEIVTGSLPTVPLDGIAIIESTAEGMGGKFYEISEQARIHKEMRRNLSPIQFRFHFFPWWKAPDYRMSPKGIVISPEEHEYFDRVEIEMGCILHDDQRAWYIAKREDEFSGDAELMWREFPSTPAECWMQSTEGKFLANALARARSQGRIGSFPVNDRVRVNTFWDIGAGDGTGIWLHQHIGGQDRMLRYIEGWDLGYKHFIAELRATGHLFGTHYLPHDAVQQRQQKDSVGSPLSMLQELAPDWTFTIVPRVETLQHGIDLLRSRFSTLYFDEEGCKAGLEHLSLYSKKWNERLGTWGDMPEKDAGHSEAPDALRQWAQGYDPASEHAQQRPQRRRNGGMAA